MSKFSNTTAKARHSGSSGTLPARKRSSAPCSAASPASLASRSTQSSADRQNAYSAYTPARLRAGSSENAR